MLKDVKSIETRITTTADRLKKLIFDGAMPLRVSAYHVAGEPVSRQDALAATYRAFSVGSSWGSAWGTTWFRFEGEVPKVWKGRNVVALVDLGWNPFSEGFSAEGLIFVEGKARQALNLHRSDFPITPCAKGGESVSFLVEAAANRSLMSPQPIAEIRRDRTKWFTLRQADLVCFNPDVFSAYYDLLVAGETMMALPEDSQQRADLRHILNEAVAEFHPDCPETIDRMRKLLQLNRLPPAVWNHQVKAVGHAHIDTAWLWPLRETIRKCARTFSTMLRYMERYPEFVFACSQAQQYAWMKTHYPEIHADIKKAVKRGQWEPVGSMWVETDCHLVSGESLVRQVLYGKRYFLEEFGCETRDCWLPDVFGYSAALPQILRKSDIDYFFTQKISWSQTNRFPHHTFFWEGLDGSRVFTHFTPADTYNAEIDSAMVIKCASNYLDKESCHHSLLAYGYGDGGGGPSIAMLEKARRIRDFPGLPTLRQGSVASFFDAAAREACNLPLWSGELYLELHRGTYTSQARNKRANRRSETALRNAEILESLACALGIKDRHPLPSVPRRPHETDALEDKARPGKAALDRAWKLTLLNQFHDIIPGSSIDWVYEDSLADYETVETLTQGVTTRATEKLVSAIDTRSAKTPSVVFNTLGFARTCLLDFGKDGFRSVQLPSLGYHVVDLSTPATPPADPISVKTGRREIVVQNASHHIQFDQGGHITSLIDRVRQRELVDCNTKANVFELYPDLPNKWDAWDIEEFHRRGLVTLAKKAAIKVVHQCPELVRIERSLEIGKSRIEQLISVYAHTARIDFRTQVNWKERHRLLKVSFPTTIRSARATYETQFGHLERPTHANTSWDAAKFEVCAQRWADLSEYNCGIALLNDCKYGYDIHGSVMNLSLLRSSTAPDPCADQGSHEFTYALYPHERGPQAGGVIEAAADLNIPPVVRTARASEGQLSAQNLSFVTIDGEGIMLEALKQAEDGRGMIMRLYESRGGHQRMSLSITLPFRQTWITNLLERNMEEIPIKDGILTLGFTPFEVKTLRLI